MATGSTRRSKGRERDFTLALYMEQFSQLRIDHSTEQFNDIQEIEDYKYGYKNDHTRYKSDFPPISDKQQINVCLEHW